MRWISFERQGSVSFGIVSEDAVIDVGEHYSQYESLKALLASDDFHAVGADAATRASDYALSEITYLPVILHPDKILCAGLNYKAHMEETGNTDTSAPTLFTRFASSQVGHDQAMVKPRESDMLDFEGEIALIIGKAGRRISKDTALSHVAGYSCYNDGSVRDYQRHTSQFTPGKNFIHTGGFGPWMMTPDEIGNLDNMEITTRLNGEVMQNSSAAFLIFSFSDLISYCSSFTELVPGDVIVTGTPAGVGAARKPPVFMMPGDQIDIEVKPIGMLSNTIVEG
jgi:2-keto-4-pentenoate hydratase/2-oxohepta-3-ene-1,7-dioic acid hydratase in catechol pathway